MVAGYVGRPQLRGPEELIPVLEFLNDTKSPFHVHGFPDVYDDASKIALARKFIDVGPATINMDQRKVILNCLR